MNLYTHLCSRVLFPLHEAAKGHRSVSKRRALEASQWGSRQQVEQGQADTLRRFLVDVGTHVPYYRDLFRARGFDPAGVRSARDLARLPLLTKADIRKHQAALRADDHGPLTAYNTGGSSGEPLTFFIGKGRKSHDVAAKWRATRWWGVDIGDAEAVVWGSPIEHGTQDRLRHWRDRLLRSTLLPAFDMSAASLDGYIADLRRIRPRMLFGYPSALAYIARHALSRGVAMDDLGIQVAFVTSERLYDEQRADISAVFGCPVANGYGGRDAGFIAHECPEGGMHVSAEDIVVEIVDAAGNTVPAGHGGEVVVTHLATRDFPFVRYRTGDVASLDVAACRCGRGLPMLRAIEGRTTDFVVAADGTVMHGLALIYVVRELAGVQSFKVVQHGLDRAEVLLVVNSGFDESAGTKHVIDGFRQRLGASVRVSVRLVDDIPAEASGKFRYIVSHVQPTG